MVGGIVVDAVELGFVQCGVKRPLLVKVEGTEGVLNCLAHLDEDRVSDLIDRSAMHR